MPADSDDISAGVFDAARRATLDAGRLALSYFRPGERTHAQIDYKEGGSPVTEADLAVDAMLREVLTALGPGFGWLSEETVDSRDRLDREHVWVVDPIDGTRSFARGDPDWTVAVGLVTRGEPVAGFVYAPVSGEFFETRPGGAALLNGRPVRASARTALSGARLTGPKPLVDRLASQTRIERAPKVHSLAYRIVHVADGRIDAGLAGGRSHDWDLAAAHAVLLAAGGTLQDGFGQAPRYNRASTLQPPLSASGLALAPALAAALTRLGSP